MEGDLIPHFRNDSGHLKIEIGVKKFVCSGAHPPFDHPHVFLDMGKDSFKVCPYCSTHFSFNDKINTTETIPSGCFYYES